MIIIKLGIFAASTCILLLTLAQVVLLEMVSSRQEGHTQQANMNHAEIIAIHGRTEAQISALNSRIDVISRAIETVRLRMTSSPFVISSNYSVLLLAIQRTRYSDALRHVAPSVSMSIDEEHTAASLQASLATIERSSSQSQSGQSTGRPSSFLPSMFPIRGFLYRSPTRSQTI